MAHRLGSYATCCMSARLTWILWCQSDFLTSCREQWPCVAGAAAASILDAVMAPDSTMSMHLEMLPGNFSEHFEGSLPADQHFSLLSASPVAAQVAAQHHALLTALNASSEKILGGLSGGASGVLRQLVALPGADRGSLRPHMAALLKAVAASTAPSVFLTEQLAAFTQSPVAQVRLV